MLGYRVGLELSAS